MPNGGNVRSTPGGSIRFQSADGSGAESVRAGESVAF